MSNMIESLNKWLLSRENYPHKSVNTQPKVKLIETHISKVYLTGAFAYKIKKPVNFGFLNFTKLEDRKFFCEEEIRLNTRLAPKIYLKTVRITEDGDTFCFNGTGKTVEYAVKMHQFDTNLQLNILQKKNKLEINLASKLAEVIALFHQSASIAQKKSEFGLPKQVLAPMQQNFEQILPLLKEEKDVKNIKKLQIWTTNKAKALNPLLLKRKENNFIKECHGDMHLENMTIYQDQIQIFDGIEFNDSFKWIDTTSEIAFFCMDLEFQKANHFSNKFINDYLSHSGDYQLLKLLTFYKVYRALVRAKIALLTASQNNGNSNFLKKQQHIFRKYINLALSYIQPKDTECFITCGFSGSGKSYISEQLAQERNLIRIRSDIERKRHFSHLSCDSLYNKETTTKTYSILLNLTKIILNEGYSIIIDATFLKRKQRLKFERHCINTKISYRIVSIISDKDTIKKRILKRAERHNNVSDADIKILNKQIFNFDAFDEFENKNLIVFNNNGQNLINDILRN